MDTGTRRTERHDTIVIGGGQAGLSVGYHLAERGREFVILDASERIGDAWRHRWDSLRLFTPARYSGLDGMPFPAEPYSFPTKDEMADYLEAYAAHFDLPVRLGTRVERLARDGDRFVVETTTGRFVASNVVVAMANFQKPKRPAFAADLRPDIVQLHSAEYRNPGQLRAGPVLLVGAGNSGAEIAAELAPRHPTWLAGRDVGHLPFQIGGFAGRHGLTRLVARGLFHRVLTVDTPIGRKARPKMTGHSGPLIRVKPKHLAALGVERAPRVVDTRDGLPMLEDGRVLEPANVIWCTGFDPGFSWIDLPIGDGPEPDHDAGILEDQPGLYFVGLHFLRALSSAMIHGVGHDAARIVDHIVTTRPVPEAPRPDVVPWLPAGSQALSD